MRASNPRGWSETVWTGAGSGCSTVYAKPAWQVDTLCAPVSPGVGGRMEADVSAVADPNTGVAVYGPAGAKSSGWLVFGGTSVASPLVAAMYGLANDTQTFVSSLYMTAATPGPYATSPYLDVVTSGNNGTCGGAYLCTADGNGDYNGPTGLGTPAGAGGF